MEPNESKDRAEEQVAPEALAVPLPEDWPERTEALAQSWVCTRQPRDPELHQLESFTSLCLRYGYLEKRVQGEILCDIPAHLAILRGDQFDDLLLECEALADAEREGLGLEPGPIEDLAEVLDARGIKTIELPPPAPTYSGAFLFENDTGPALLSMAPINSPSSRFIIAHQYCHLLADVDPYANRFCAHEAPGKAEGSQLKGPTWGGRLLETSHLDPDDETALPELRADLFARCLLVPRDHFVATLREFGQGKRGRYELERLTHIAFYYSVPEAVIVHRLMDLELIPLERAQALITDLQAAWPEGRAEEPLGIPAITTVGWDLADPLPVGLPVRFVNLSLALFIQGRLTPDQIGKVLGADEDTVRQLLEWVEHARREAEERKREAKLPDLGTD